MTETQFQLLKHAIVAQQSLVSSRSPRRTIQACQKRGWLVTIATKSDDTQDWYAVTPHGLEDSCTYQFATVYDAVDDNIFWVFGVSRGRP